jgi:hypothetical protein
MRVNDWLTVASAGPVNVSAGRTPLTPNESIVSAEVDELLDAGGTDALDEGVAVGVSLGVGEGSGDGDTEGEDVGCGEGDGDGVGCRA